MLIFWPFLSPCVAAGVTDEMASGNLQQGLTGFSNLSWQHNSLPSIDNSHLDNLPRESQWPAPPIPLQREACGMTVSPLHGEATVDLDIVNITVMWAWGATERWCRKYQYKVKPNPYHAVHMGIYQKIPWKRLKNVYSSKLELTNFKTTTAESRSD